MSVSISSDTDNPIPQGSSPTLSCTVSLSPAVDIEVEVVTEWNGPTYGLREYTTTEPVLNSSAEVPTYTSTARLNAPGTFYDSGNYYCSVVINPLNNSNFIRSTPEIYSPTIPGLLIKLLYCSTIINFHAVLFLYPHRPMLLPINQVGVNWILVPWEGNRATDNISYYEVTYSYAGECSGISDQNSIRRVDGTNSSYNITGLQAYLNYSITLVAANGTGRGPPYTDYARTRSMGVYGVQLILLLL